jgi:hypothetical protein
MMDAAIDNEDQASIADLFVNEEYVHALSLAFAGQAAAGLTYVLLKQVPGANLHLWRSSPESDVSSELEQCDPCCNLL